MIEFWFKPLAEGVENMTRYTFTAYLIFAEIQTNKKIMDIQGLWDNVNNNRFCLYKVWCTINNNTIFFKISLIDKSLDIINYRTHRSINILSYQVLKKIKYRIFTSTIYDFEKGPYFYIWIPISIQSRAPIFLSYLWIFLRVFHCQQHHQGIFGEPFWFHIFLIQSFLTDIMYCFIWKGWEIK